MKKFTHTIEAKLDPRLKKSSKDKSDPWIRGGANLGNRNTYSGNDASMPGKSGSFWSSPPTTQSGYDASDDSFPLSPPTPHREIPQRDLPRSEEARIKMAIELSKKVEDDRRRERLIAEKNDHDLLMALEMSKMDIRNNTPVDPFAPPPSSGGSMQKSMFDENPFAPQNNSSSNSSRNHVTHEEQANSWSAFSQSAAPSTQLSNSASSTSANMAKPEPIRKSSLYEKEAALHESLGEKGFEDLLAKQGEYSELDAVLKSGNQKTKMIGYGFSNLHILWGAGDCAVLVCLCFRLLSQGTLQYQDVERCYGNQAVDVSAERRSLLQYLYDNAINIPQLKEALLMEAELIFPDIKNPPQLIQQYVTKMTKDQQYLGITEMSAGAYRDNYILVFIRERPFKLGGGLDISGMVAPLKARHVFYCLFYDAGHFDLLEPHPIPPTTPSTSPFAGAPTNLQAALETLYKEQLKQYSVSENTFKTPSRVVMPSTQFLTPTLVGAASTNESSSVMHSEPMAKEECLAFAPAGNNLWANDKYVFGSLSSNEKPGQKLTLAQLQAQKEGINIGTSRGTMTSQPGLTIPNKVLPTTSTTIGYGMSQNNWNIQGSMQGNRQGMQRNMQGMQGGMQGMQGGMQRMPVNMQGGMGMGVRPPMHHLNGGMQGNMQGMPGGMQGMQGNMQGMPGGMQGMQGNMQGIQGNMQGGMGMGVRPPMHQGPNYGFQY